jgi:transposase
MCEEARMMQRRFPAPHDWREGRRLRGWELAQQGWTQSAIAAALGVTQGAVSQWLARARAAGPAGLRRRTSPGPPPKLAPAQWAQVPALLARGAAAFGFRGEVWTAPRIAAVVATHFGVRYHPAQISRRLRASKWSPQRPLQRATQRDEAAIARWYAERWPGLKKGRPKKAGPSSG